MTNDAPKRIWACPDDAEWITGHWDLASDGLPMEAEYIRADHAQSNLRAAVVSAANAAMDAAYEDAQASLEAAEREARNEARREAEAAISKLRMQNQDIVSQWNGAIDQASDVILALMEDTDDDT